MKPYPPTLSSHSIVYITRNNLLLFSGKDNTNLVKTDITQVNKDLMACLFILVGYNVQSGKQVSTRLSLQSLSNGKFLLGNYTMGSTPVYFNLLSYDSDIGANIGNNTYCHPISLFDESGSYISNIDPNQDLFYDFLARNGISIKMKLDNGKFIGATCPDLGRRGLIPLCYVEYYSDQVDQDYSMSINLKQDSFGLYSSSKSLTIECGTTCCNEPPSYCGIPEYSLGFEYTDDYLRWTYPKEFETRLIFEKDHYTLKYKNNQLYSHDGKIKLTGTTPVKIVEVQLTNIPQLLINNSAYWKSLFRKYLPKSDSPLKCNSNLYSYDCVRKCFDPANMNSSECTLAFQSTCKPMDWSEGITREPACVEYCKLASNSKSFISCLDAFKPACDTLEKYKKNKICQDLFNPTLIDRLSDSHPVNRYWSSICENETRDPICQCINQEQVEKIKRERIDFYYNEHLKTITELYDGAIEKYKSDVSFVEKLKTDKLRIMGQLEQQVKDMKRQIETVRAACLNPNCIKKDIPLLVNGDCKTPIDIKICNQSIGLISKDSTIERNKMIQSCGLEKQEQGSNFYILAILSALVLILVVILISIGIYSL